MHYCIDALTLDVGLSVHEAHAGQLLQLTREPLLWRLVRVASSHLSQHLSHELVEHGVTRHLRSLLTRSWSASLT